VATRSTARPGAARVADVVVVGAGIVGCSAAALLADTGRSVVVVDPEGVAAGASGRNQGVLQHPFDPVLAPLYHSSLERYRELADGEDGDATDPFRLPPAPAGLLMVTSDEDRAREATERYRSDAAELRPEFIGAADLRRLEPALAPGLAATRLETGAAVPPGAATAAYARRAARAGVGFELGAVWRLLVDDGKARGVGAGSRRIEAGAVLVTAGAWTSSVLADSGVRLPVPIRPLWGVVASVRLASPPSHVVEEEAVSGPAWTDALPADGIATVFSIVTLGGTSAVGATRLAERPDPDVVAASLLARGARFVPSLSDATPIGVRACPRPLSADGRPFLGPVPDVDRLFLAAGHGPWGISTGPGSAALVVDELLGRGRVSAALRVDRLLAGSDAPAGLAS
jgi:glycine/D-amino acid oxidase-like deaminating enzyme